MAEVITPEARAVYKDVLDEMFRLRQRVVVDQWGWSIPGNNGVRDIDQFDTDHTVYIVEFDENRTELRACTRLNPTTRPHMMSELFADTCNLQPYPTGPAVWECSRFVTDKTRFSSKEEDFRTRARLGIGITEFCLSAGIGSLTWFTHQVFFNVVQIVWNTVPLGLAADYEGDDWQYIPAVSTIDEAALRRQRARLGAIDEVLTYAYAPIGASQSDFFNRHAA